MTADIPKGWRPASEPPSESGWYFAKVDGRWCISRYYGDGEVWMTAGYAGTVCPSSYYPARLDLDANMRPVVRWLDGAASAMLGGGGSRTGCVHGRR